MLSWSIIAALAAKDFSPLSLLLTYCVASSCLVVVLWAGGRLVPHLEGRSEESDDEVGACSSSDESSSENVEMGLATPKAIGACSTPLSRTPRSAFEGASPTGASVSTPKGSFTSTSRSRCATPVLLSAGGRSPFDAIALRTSWKAALTDVLPSLSLLFAMCSFSLLPLPEAVAVTLLPSALERGACGLLPWVRRLDGPASRRRMDTIGIVSFSLGAATFLALVAVPPAKIVKFAHEQVVSPTGDAIRRQIRTRDRFGVFFACAHAVVGTLARLRPRTSVLETVSPCQELCVYLGASWMAFLLFPFAGALSLSSAARDWLTASNADVYGVAAGIDLPKERSCLRFDVFCIVLVAASLARCAKMLSMNATTRLSAPAASALALVRAPAAWVMPVVLGLPGLALRGVVCSIAAVSSLAFLALDFPATPGSSVSGLDDPIPFVTERLSSKLSRSLSSSSASSPSLSHLAVNKSKFRSSGSPDAHSKPFQFDLDNVQIGTIRNDSLQAVPLVAVGA